MKKLRAREKILMLLVALTIAVLALTAPAVAADVALSPAVATLDELAPAVLTSTANIASAPVLDFDIYLTGYDAQAIAAIIAKKAAVEAANAACAANIRAVLRANGGRHARDASMMIVAAVENSHEATFNDSRAQILRI